MVNTVTTSIAGKQITIETGRLAKQTDGAVLVTCGNNMVLVTAVSAKEAKPDQSFFPLTVEFIEKYYAIGKIPGGYFKREGKPSTDSILSARIIDRPIRPLFPEGYLNDTQVVATILSADGSFPMDTLSSLGASAALHISNIPFNGPTAACQVGRVNGQFIANPTPEQLAQSDMDIIVSGTKNGILMVEGEAKFISEADALAALKFGHQSIMPLLQMQEELREKTGSVAKRAFTPAVIDADFRTQAENLITPLITKALSQKVKQDRYAGFDAAKDAAMTQLVKTLTDEKLQAQRKKEVGAIIEDIKYKVARAQILDGGRIDGRDLKTVRPIMCEVGLLPRAHGSGLFQRGETQCLGTVTLGTADDEQTVETLNGTVKRKFNLHYNFPPYSVGEVGRFGGQGRREIGHGNLAERAIKAVTPDHVQFPYTIRIVSEVLESNGSSSMGSVCAGTLALLDAGVKIKANVAGIAMGLIKEGDKVAVLSDILGDEDHLGDMDFKVAGSATGITALQMDIKIDSVSFAVMETALNQAKEGRLHILGEMEKVMKAPRGQISEFAPRIETIKIKPDKIREVIGSGGKVIRGITEQTGVKIEIQDDGTINIASADPAATKKAIAMIEAICAEAEVGKTYKGKVMKVAEFGAFVEILPNTQGLLHISELANERVRQVTDVVKEGDMVDVKVLEVDRSGRIKLSRKALLQ
ncbi:polyribonucleotide nucleotidyltransferase [Pseudobdellovibrio sp. HCB154]|uniref:polyribonucleotide nucleotidyltransferase n=1 Tax=Pseudobdellovibrio sp. HCB154 TaxID=3386277 RepID=UPI00391726D4